MPKISDETNFTVDSGTLSEDQLESMRSLGVFSGHSQRGDTISGVTLDVGRLAEIVFEYQALQSVASRVEVDILHHFRQADGNTFTTSEIADAIDRPKSSVSRALGNLTERELLTKVQTGVYRYQP